MKTMVKVGVIGLSAMLLAAGPVPPSPIQSYDEYRSWLVACDNTLRCIVRGFPQERPLAEITIERQAGPAGAMSAAIRAAHSFALADIRIDGKPANLSLMHDIPNPPSASQWRACCSACGLV